MAFSSNTLISAEEAYTLIVTEAGGNISASAYNLIALKKSASYTPTARVNKQSRHQ